MRRQNSEDASQFRYISGDQFQSTAAGSPSSVTGVSWASRPAHEASCPPAKPSGNQNGALRLELAGADHKECFRRAGSQPAPSQRGGGEFGSSGGALAGPGNWRRGQLCVTPPALLGGLAGAQQCGRPLAAATPTNTSSSSGVSSGSVNNCTTTTTSNTIEQPEAGQLATGDLETSWSRRRRQHHLAGLAVRQAALQQERAAAEAPQRQEMGRRESLTRLGRRLSRETPPEGLARGQAERQDPDDSEDPNEIYSTPNDSIQSVSICAGGSRVGGTALGGEALDERLSQQQGAAGQRASAPHFLPPIVKSFSTNNFALVAQRLAGAPTCRKKASGWRKEVAGEEPAATHADQREALARRGAPGRDLARQKRHSDSRFFISSSSSSEDSQPTSQNSNSTNSAAQNGATEQQENTQAGSPKTRPDACDPLHIPVELGLHQHPRRAPPSATGGRPNSLLILAPPEVQANGNLLVGSPFGSAGPDPVVAAVSPQQRSGAALDSSGRSCRLVNGQHVHSPAAHQLGRLGAELASARMAPFKKSPSLFEMGAQNRPSAEAQDQAALVARRPMSTRFSSRYPSGRGVAARLPLSMEEEGVLPANRHQWLGGAAVCPHAAGLQQASDRLNSRLTANQAAAGFQLNNNHQQYAGHNQSKVNGGQPDLGHTKHQDTPFKCLVPNSVSLHDCNLNNYPNGFEQGPMLKSVHHETLLESDCISGAEENRDEPEEDEAQLGRPSTEEQIYPEYKLAKMLLKFSSDPEHKDELGNTALMQCALSDNLGALKCLVEHGADVNAVNEAQDGCLDLLCAKQPNEIRLEMFRYLLDNKVDLDRVRAKDGSRLLDRVIGQHKPPQVDKIPYIDHLLHNGAKLSSATWLAAHGKYDVLFRLLRKLCQDGYYLYKQNSIEAAVYRFEYGLKRIDELEEQMISMILTESSNAYYQPGLAGKTFTNGTNRLVDLKESNGGQYNFYKNHFDHQAMAKAAQEIKYQIYLGLSRCERKRRVSIPDGFQFGKVDPIGNVI